MTSQEKIVRSALAQTRITRLYDPAYVLMKYPGGDVSPERGVCTDVVIRAFRSVGLDLQRAVHEDISRHARAYGIRRADSNIDHRRVTNLMVYFARQQKSLPLSRRATDYAAGDVVAWRLPNGRLHIGVVVGAQPGLPAPAVVHNVGAGAQCEDVLFAWSVIGHYRWFR